MILENDKTSVVRLGEVRAPFHSLRVMSVFLVNVGYSGAMAAGKAAARLAGDSETRGRVAKETFRVSLPGAWVWILPGVGVEGAVTGTRGNRGWLGYEGKSSGGQVAFTKVVD